MDKYKNVVENFSNTGRPARKLLAFYTNLDLDDPEFVFPVYNNPSYDSWFEEMRMHYPMVEEYPVYVCHPLATEREYLELTQYLFQAGVLDNNFVQNATLNLSHLTQCSNLANLTLNGITANNVETLPDTVN